MFDTVYLLTQFADETTITLDGSERSFQTALEVLKQFASASVHKITLQKLK